MTFRCKVALSWLALCCIVGSFAAGLLWPYIPDRVTRGSASDIELGTFYVGNEPVHPDSKWVVAAYPLVTKPLPDCNLVLNYFLVNGTLVSPLCNETSIARLEAEFMKVNASEFWGTLFIAEEVYKSVVQFVDGINTTFYGKRMLGRDLYLAQMPGSSEDAWRDEMYFRMMQGFYEHYHALGLKIGITAARSCVLDESPSSGIAPTFGHKAFQFLVANFDFVILYQYTAVFEGIGSLKNYFDAIDVLFTQQQKFWILTRVWDESIAYWQREAIAPEIVRCLDRNITILQYKTTAPDPLSYEAIWNLTCKGIELYRTGAYYLENRIVGRNLLTGQEGYTYGWMEPKFLGATVLTITGIAVCGIVAISWASRRQNSRSSRLAKEKR